MYFLSFAICLVFFENATEQAQPKTVPVEIVAQLEVLVEHDDPQVAKTAIRAIIGFAESGDEELRKAAILLKERLRLRARKFFELGTKDSSNPKKLISDRRSSAAGLTIVKSQIDAKDLVWLEFVKTDVLILSLVGLEDIADQDLRWLNGLEQLVSLNVEEIPIQGTGFENVYLRSLRRLNLRGCDITDEGVAKIHKRKFPALDEIHLRESKVTGEAIAKLKERYQHATITWDNSE